MMRMTVLALIFALVGATGCKSESDSAKVDTPSAQQKTEKAAEQQKPVEPEILSKPSGVRYQELVVGTGAVAALGTNLICHYTVWIADSTGLVKGQFLQSSKTDNQPLPCTLGQNLINGWSDGMVGMKEGGTRRLYVPWQQAYGVQGRPGIPGKANLIFEIDFIKIAK